MAYTQHNLLRGQEQVSLYFRTPEKQLAGKCLDALCTTYFGAEQGHSDLVRRGLHRYSYALSELNGALSDPDRCGTHDVLESIVIMSVLEVRGLAILSREMHLI